MSGTEGDFEALRMIEGVGTFGALAAALAGYVVVEAAGRNARPPRGWQVRLAGRPPHHPGRPRLDMTQLLRPWERRSPTPGQHPDPSCHRVAHLRRGTRHRNCLRRRCRARETCDLAPVLHRPADVLELAIDADTGAPLRGEPGACAVGAIVRTFAEAQELTGSDGPGIVSRTTMACRNLIAVPAFPD